ncbi:ferric reductase-like transmembrane domain-containing protein [Roseovarius sp. S1116L3]|uniref:ferric reductase-like transmembrane domain-containing protein n=1 Tax=Roseovarius roseus TaxID=3342636 RepID=UPI0037287E3C
MRDIGPRKALAWGTLVIVIAAPLALAAVSPLLAWRQPIYIAAGFAGVVALALLLLQPLLAGGYLPGLTVFREGRIHRWIGVSLLAAVIIHVIGLWITSPPDVVDALLFTSPTPFSDWGVIAMWALFATALLAALRKRLRLRWRFWLGAHGALAVVIVSGSVVHAMLIDGTMEVVSKTALCALVLIATAKTLADLRVWRVRKSPR